MEKENTIIIALVVLIIIVAVVAVFVTGVGMHLNNSDPVVNKTASNTTHTKNITANSTATSDS